MVFHFSSLLTCGSFSCDEKKVLYFGKKVYVCVQTLVYDHDKALILHCMENFDQSTGKMQRFKLTKKF